MSHTESQRSAFDVWEEEKRVAHAEKASVLREFRRQMRDTKAMQVRLGSTLRWRVLGITPYSSSEIEILN
jgi:hypothetical protein